MFKEKLAIVIATKDRPCELTRLLESIDRQDVKPVETLVVDGGKNSVKDLVGAFSGLNVRYIRKIPPSLTTQRNVGIRAVKGEATHIAFFDDDVILEKNCLLNMMKFWEKVSSDTVGASFNDVQDAYKGPTLLEKIFMVNAERAGKVMRSGFQSKICSLGNTMPVEWLVGCAMIYKRTIFEDHIFDEWFKGYSYGEDLDFSYMLGKKYKMFLVADAKVKHVNNLEKEESSLSLGIMQVINRLYFVRKHRELSVPLCYWSCVGLFLNNTIKGFLQRDERYIRRSKGNMKGFVSSIFKR